MKKNVSQLTTMDVQVIAEDLNTLSMLIQFCIFSPTITFQDNMNQK